MIQGFHKNYNWKWAGIMEEFDSLWYLTAFHVSFKLPTSLGAK